MAKRRQPLAAPAASGRRSSNRPARSAFPFVRIVPPDVIVGKFKTCRRRRRRVLTGTPACAVRNMTSYRLIERGQEKCEQVLVKMIISLPKGGHYRGFGSVLPPIRPSGAPKIAADDNGFGLTAQDSDRTIADSTGKSSDSAKGAAKSAAIDPMLKELLARWNNLPPVIKSAILAVARTHKSNG